MRLFKLWEVPGENRTNFAGTANEKPNHNPFDDLSVEMHKWGVVVPHLDFHKRDYEAFADVCPSEGPEGGEWAC